MNIHTGGEHQHQRPGPAPEERDRGTPGGTPGDRPEGLSPELAALLRTGPFHEALRAAIAARGLALNRIRHRLAQRGVTIGVTTLSYWQQGVRRPARAESLRALPALEEVLGVPRDALAGLLLTEAGTEVPTARPYRTLMNTPGPLNEILEELGSSAEGGLHTTCQIDRVDIGRRRELLGRHTQQLLQAHRDGVDRYLAIYVGDPGCDTGRVAFRAEENCRVGHIRGDPETGVVVAELLFDTRLRAGETRLISHRVTDGTAGVSEEYVRGFSYSGGQYILQVGFDPDALPVRCHRFSRSSERAPESEREELVLSGRYPTVHLAETQVARRMLGIRWEWA